METESFFFPKLSYHNLTWSPQTYPAPVGPTERNVYTNKIRTIDNINKIFCAISAIAVNMLQRVFANFEHRVQQYIDADCDCFQHFM
jgi:hypothetical protein